jgi:Zn-dependent peptidase ImmA (M78 family)
MSVAFARSQGERWAAQAGVGGPPVDVHAIARKLNIHVIEADLGHDVSGLLVRTPGQQISICIQYKDSSVRKRFTIAHELAHHLLGHQFEAGSHVHVDRGNFISQRGVRASQGVDPKEVEANQFAAALLMPSGWVRAVAAEMQKGGPLVDHHVTELAKRFQVSEQAMTIRLSGLRLL